jgi:Sulfotransferase family
MIHAEPALLSLADSIARGIGLGTQPLEADSLIDQAERRAGRRFRSLAFEPGLRMLFESCQAEADLSVFGRVSLQQDTGRLLRNVLRLEQAEEENPDILNGAVPAPIFITGLPRSGTTFLQMLMAEDQAAVTPRTWQIMFPYPELGDRGRDRRVQRAQTLLGAYRRLAPDLQGLHPIGATVPQECTDITAHTGESLRFDTMYYVPSYLRWLERRGHDAAFRFHKRFLQHLQAQGGASRRWVLKCPDHVFTLDSIFATYPDARIVFMHRDPREVLPSVAKLTEALRAPFTRRHDKRAIGAEITQRCYEGVERMLVAADSLPQSSVLNLSFEELVTDPLRTLGKLYRHFDLPIDGFIRSRFKAFLQGSSRGGYAVHHYEPAEFGLDLGLIRERFQSYERALANFAAQGVTA